MRISWKIVSSSAPQTFLNEHQKLEDSYTQLFSLVVWPQLSRPIDCCEKTIGRNKETNLGRDLSYNAGNVWKTKKDPINLGIDHLAMDLF